MKPLFSFLFCYALILSGCSKNDQDNQVKEPSDGVLLKLAGRDMTFIDYTTAYTTDQDWHMLNITGMDEINRRHLTILIRKQGELTPGEYIYTQWSPDHTAIIVLGEGADMGVGDYYNPQNLVTSNPVTITITSVSNGRITGSFKGDLRKRDNIVKNIQGNFNVVFTR